MGTLYHFNGCSTGQQAVPNQLKQSTNVNKKVNSS